MPPQQGKYTLSDIDQQPQQQGQYTAANIGTDAPPSPALTGMAGPTTLPTWKQVKSVLTGVPTGFIKSMQQTLAGPVPTGQPAGPGDTVIFRNPRTGQAVRAPTQQEVEQSKPQGLSEQLGAAAEQGAEMMATGGPLREGAVAAGSRLPFLGKFMGPGSRVAAESANAALNAKTHGQDPNAAALVGAGGAATAEALPWLSNALKNAAVNQYQKALYPTQGPNKFIAQKVTPGLLERGEVGSIQGISDRAAANMAQAGQAVRTAENAIPVAAQSDITPVLQKLNSIKQKYMPGGTVAPGREGVTDYIDSMMSDLSARAQNGTMGTRDLIQFRRMLDEPVAYASGYSGKELIGNKQIDKAAANAMRDILNSNNPNLAEANASFNFWSNVRKVASATAQRQIGQQGAIKTVMTAAGIAGGLGHGGLSVTGASEAALTGAGMYVLSSMMRSPAWRTTSAVLKNRIADAMATNNAGAFFRAAGDFSAATASQHGAQPSGQQDNTGPRVLPFLPRLTTQNQ